MSELLEPPTIETREIHMECTMVLIKLMMDSYVSENPEHHKNFIFIFFELLNSGNVDLQIHAFDIIMNLAVHVHLLEELYTPTSVTGNCIGDLRIDWF
jgi:hypothetical protein